MITNSLFNDSIELFYENLTSSQAWVKVDLIRTGIAWEADKKYRFKNPALENQTLENQTLEEVLRAADYARPRNWSKDLRELDPENPENNGLQNEYLMVWMRTAALPNIRKLYHRISHVGDLEAGLPDTRLKINVDYNFPVKPFSGTKSVIISKPSLFGGKNYFLGFLGGILVVMYFAHFLFGRWIPEYMSSRISIYLPKLKTFIRQNVKLCCYLSSVYMFS